MFLLSAQVSSGALVRCVLLVFLQQVEEILQMSPTTGVCGVNKNGTVLFASVIYHCLWILFLYCIVSLCGLPK